MTATPLHNHLIVVVVYYQTRNPEVFGPFFNMERAEQWALNIRVRNKRITKTTIDTVRLPFL